MSQITTNNLISTPNIEGNISTCKTELSIINCAKNNYLFICTDVGYATNNCSGDTTIYENWELTGFSWLIIVFIMAIAITLFLKKLFTY